VVTLWTTGATIAAPLRLIGGGPLIQLTGTGTGLVASGHRTLLLVPVAAVSVLTRSPQKVGHVTVGAAASDQQAARFSGGRAAARCSPS
jgi:hypothetical protein